MSVAAYTDPLELAKVTAERVDQGVDYAGTGQLVALGPGKVTEVLSASQSGWPGEFIEYQLTGGSLAGEDVYYAEGVNSEVKPGETLTAGQPVATLVPGSSTGIEIGYGSGSGSQTYAAAHGGWTSSEDKDSTPTASGEAFSKLIASLGGPAGVTTPGVNPIGQAPGGSSSSNLLDSIAAGATEAIPGVGPALNGLTTIFGGAGQVGGAVGGALTSPITGAVDSALSSAEQSALSWLESNLLKGALYGALVIAGVIIAGYGIARTFSSRPQAGAGASAAALALDDGPELALA